MSSVSFVNRKSARHDGNGAITVLGAKMHRQPTKQRGKLERDFGTKALRRDGVM
jgi:hypothetical protein